MWERACSRRRSVSQQMYRLIHRFREQARSHSGLVVLDRLQQCFDFFEARTREHIRLAATLL